LRPIDFDIAAGLMDDYHVIMFRPRSESESKRETGQARASEIFPRVSESLRAKCWTAHVFTALHAMQMRSSDENSVRPSVCLSHACIV